jgi:hypothetical protein
VKKDKESEIMRTRYAIGVMFLVLVIVAVGNLLYTNKVNNDSNHQWCATLVAIVQPQPGADPPATERGIKQRELLVRLARDKGCL